MFAKINAAGLFGVEGFLVETEVDAGSGIPQLNLTGALSARTREGQYRVWTALRNSGIRFRAQKITVNLSPAFRPKNGTGFDLSIALGMLCAAEGISSARFSDCAFLGELGLDGRVKPVHGVLPMALALKRAGMRVLVTAPENVREAALVEELLVLGCPTVSLLFSGVLKAEASLGGAELLLRILNSPLSQAVADDPCKRASAVSVQEPDFCEVRGQPYLKRAAEIAAAGQHNLLFSGPAGSGKTMIAERMPTLLPPLTRAEDLEISSLYSICGLLRQDEPLLGKRPFRAPHHSISAAAFSGGGARLLPGELSLASGGVLFMDELPLFHRTVLEMLREPLETHKITITRAAGSVVYSADFQFLAAQNNCFCGRFPHPDCSCSNAQIAAYIGKLSKPVLERIDLCAEARPLQFEELQHAADAPEAEESSDAIRARVLQARERQAFRFRDEPAFKCNSRIPARFLPRFCVLRDREQRLAAQLYQAKQLSGRTYHKLLRTARTIADLSESGEIREEHLLEASGFRGLETQLFGNRRRV